MTTATEMIMRMQEDSRRELLKHLQQEGEVVGKEVQIRLSHPVAGELGLITATVTSWKPMLDRKEIE